MAGQYLILVMAEESIQLWIAPYWRNFEIDGHSSTDIDSGLSGRPYLHWHLADVLARTEDANEVICGTIIQKLWNAVDSRVRLLQDVYDLRGLSRTLDWDKKRPSHLEILTRIGLVRPLALEQLKRIRNSVEHSDRGAPTQAACRQHVDLVWYFLRSTDIFASRRILDFTLAGRSSGDPAQGPWFAEFSFGDHGWCPHFRGRLPRTATRTHASDHTLPLEQVESREIDADSVYISGLVTAGSSACEELVRRFFFVDLPDPYLAGDDLSAPARLGR